MKLSEICTLKQWGTISKKNLLNHGYPVYGANGIIGFYDKFNHDKPTLMIGCRGTCGEIHISKGKCYINGNAMCLDNLSTDFDINYVRFFLEHYDFSKIITGTAQPQITQEGLEKVFIDKISLNNQIKISSMLSIIENSIQLEKQRIFELDNYIKSRFIELFHTIDISTQNDEWIELEALSTIYTGTTPSTEKLENWNGDILWVTPAELNDDIFIVNNTERKITEKGRQSKSLSIMPIGTVLLSTRAPIGKVAITGAPMTCNQGFKNFYCNELIDNYYLYYLLKFNRDYLNDIGSGTTFKEVSRTKIGNVKIPIPSIEAQKEFKVFVRVRK